MSRAQTAALSREPFPPFLSARPSGSGALAVETPADPSSSALARRWRQILVHGGKKSDSVPLNSVASRDLTEKLQNVGILLKILLSSYSMHLPVEGENRITSEIDYLLDPSDWEEGVLLPNVRSFVDFLRWQIFSSRYDWASLGLSDAGEILCGWAQNSSLMSAQFTGDGHVRWAANLTREGDAQMATGLSSLTFFTEELVLYVGT